MLPISPRKNARALRVKDELGGLSTSGAGGRGQDTLEPSRDLPSGNTKPGEPMGKGLGWTSPGGRPAGPRWERGPQRGNGSRGYCGRRSPPSGLLFSGGGRMAPGPFPPDVSGAKTTQQKRGLVEGEERVRTQALSWVAKSRRGCLSAFRLRLWFPPLSPLFLVFGLNGNDLHPATGCTSAL